MTILVIDFLIYVIKFWRFLFIQVLAHQLSPALTQKLDVSMPLAWMILDSLVYQMKQLTQSYDLSVISFS